MKKLIYILLFAFIGSMAVTACTEETVAPKTSDNGGGNADNPIVK